MIVSLNGRTVYPLYTGFVVGKGTRYMTYIIIYIIYAREHIHDLYT